MEARFPISALVMAMRHRPATSLTHTCVVAAKSQNPLSCSHSFRSRKMTGKDHLQYSCHAASGRRHISSISTCPPPTCPCARMPQGLDIDYKRPLDGSMSLYHEHVLIPTGKSDWESRVENDDNLPFLRDVKGLLTKGGKFANPFHNVLVSASSLPEDAQTGQQAALLLPGFQYITPKASSLASSSSEVAEALVKGFILPTRLDPRAIQTLPSSNQDYLRSLEREHSLNGALFDVRPVRDVIVLICGHGSRDSRCGIMGTILEKEFEEKLKAPSSRFKFKQPAASVAGNDGTEVGATTSLISHIGGHAFAGNVIVYVPRDLEAEGHALAGKGIWYGRVEPKHVEGIVKETIEHGRVIKDLFRGGVDAKMPGAMLRV